MEPTTTAALISGGFNLAGGLLGRSKRSSSQKHIDYYNSLRASQAWSAERAAHLERNRQIRLRVRDARLAGLHPLFALGASVNNQPASPTIVGGGQSDSGSLVGDALRETGQFISRYMSDREERERGARLMTLQERESAARVRESEANAKLAEVRASVAAQQANSRRPPVSADTPDGTMPSLRTRYRDPETGRVHSLLNPDAGLDEIAQFGYVVDMMKDFATGGPQYSRKTGKARYEWRKKNRRTPGADRRTMEIISAMRRLFQ